MTIFVNIDTIISSTQEKLIHSSNWLLILQHFAHQSASWTTPDRTQTPQSVEAGFIYKFQFLKICLKKSILKSINGCLLKTSKDSCNLKKIHKNEVQNNTRKYDLTMHIFTQFSPCTGPLINKINNVNILRNLHLFREYIHNSHCNNKHPQHEGRHTSCLSHRPNVSAFWFSVCPKHCLNALWLKAPQEMLLAENS
jgi:hypothetical protein